MSTKIAPKRGRPPAYDRTIALTAITNVFWANGFDATSLDDLSQASGMARPSLYAAFGDKRAMYLAALDRVREMLASELSLLDAEPSLVQALSGFYSRALDVYFSGGAQPRGCIAICTATTAAAAHPDIREALAEVIGGIDKAMVARFSRAREAGQLSNVQDIEGAAFLASATLHSLAVRARAGGGREKLEALAASAITLMMND
jgi:AcrR family transcriptional regulator